MKTPFQKIVANPRIKGLGVFLITMSFIGETVLRKISHFLAGKILFLLGGEVTSPGILIEKIFSIGAPIFFIYFPLLIVLGIIIKDGIQKIDWITTPILIGIILKGGIYGILSFKNKGGEFWEISQLGVSTNLLWFFIILFLIGSFVGFIIWFKEIS